METATILIIASGEELWGAERVRRDLSAAGFKVVTTEGEDFQGVIQAVQPVLIIANLADGQVGDLELCRKIIHISPAPIIAIGSSKDEGHIIEMVEEAVDDYLTRPVNSMELVARVRSILRRTHPELVPDGEESVPRGGKKTVRPARKNRFSLPGFIHHFTRRDS